MKKTLSRRVLFWVMRKAVFIQRNPYIVAAEFSKLLIAFFCGYGICVFIVVGILGLALVPSCKAVKSESVWEQAYKRGYAEKFVTSSGEPAYRWKGEK